MTQGLSYAVAEMQQALSQVEQALTTTETAGRTVQQAATALQGAWRSPQAAVAYQNALGAWFTPHRNVVAALEHLRSGLQTAIQQFDANETSILEQARNLPQSA